MFKFFGNHIAVPPSVLTEIFTQVQLFQKDLSYLLLKGCIEEEFDSFGAQ
jgi:hypothetical protein